jgi:mono/diheme cytochrome c family protein
VAAVLLVGGAGGFGVAGCGGSDQTEDTDAPEAEIFADTCGSCHTFEPAGTNGNVGPPLTNTPLSAQEISTQIENGGGGMPPGLLEGDQRESVAQWVADNAGD